MMKNNVITRLTLVAGITLALLACAPVAIATVFTVGPGGTHANVQDAVKAAITAGGVNEVRIAAGNYQGLVVVDGWFNAGELTISGGWDAAFTQQAQDPNRTVLDGAKAGSTMWLGPHGGTISVHNLTLTGGKNKTGAGITLWAFNTAHVNLLGCRIFGNEASSESESPYGGGLSAWTSNNAVIRVAQNLIMGNSVRSTTKTAYGGGAKVTGGGSGEIVFEDNVIVANSLVTDTTQSEGTGLDAVAAGQSVVTIRNNVIARNTATSKPGTGDEGVSLFAQDSARMIASGNAVFNNWGNNAQNSVNVSASASGTGSVSLSEFVIADGNGTGLYLFTSPSSSVQATNCTITGNSIWGIRGNANALYNTIVFGNAVYPSFKADVMSGNLIGVDPLFVNATLHDYRLSPGSPAINTGESNLPGGLSATDFGGKTRVMGSKVDIGAHEYGMVRMRAAALAHSTGVGKTPWRSDLDVTNAGSGSADLTLRFRTTDGETTRQATLAAGETRSWNDALVSLFGVKEAVSTSGSLGIEDPTGAVVAALRTYADLEAAGTYGQGYPVLEEGAGLVLGKVGFVPIVKSNMKFYSNIGIQNLSSAQAEARVTLFGSTGAQLGNPVAVVANPNCWAQLNDVFAKAGVASAEVAYARIEPVTPGVRVWGAASVVDRITKDPTTVEAIEPVTAGTVLRVPSVAHSSGYGGTPWRSTVAIVNAENASGNAILTFRGGSTIIKTVQLGPNALLEWADVLVELFGVDASATASGTLEIVSNRQVVVACRTYADKGTAGTYGQSYPALTVDRGLMRGTTGVLSQLRKNASTYTNIGVQNLSSVPCNGSAQLYDAQGKAIGSLLQLTPQPGGWFQISDAFLAASAGGADAASARVQVNGDGCSLWFYASVVDSLTRDPTTIELAKPLVVEPGHSTSVATAAPIE